jgi:two-component system OmpR family sensor kinase
MYKRKLFYFGLTTAFILFIALISTAISAHLTRGNLQQSNIDSRRRQFIADVSHELRTPLTIIRGEAQVTLRMQSASAEDFNQTLVSIVEQAVNLSRLVDDLLLLTRAEMNQLNLDMLSVEIMPMRESVLVVRTYILVSNR